MIMIGLSFIFYFGVVLRCPPCRADVRDPRCRVLQYVHDSLMVGGVSDRSTCPSKGVVAYGIKRTLYLMLWLGFTVMIFSICGCLLEFQS